MEFAEAEKIGDGLLTCFIRHTSASLLIQENADPDVQKDLQDFFAQLAKKGMNYRHTAEGPGRHAFAYPRGADRRPRIGDSGAGAASRRWAPGRGFMSSSIATRRIGAKCCCIIIGDSEPSPAFAAANCLQRCFRPRAIMRDHFRGGERAQPAAIGQALAMRQAIKKSGGELIARAGGVDHPRHRRGGHGMHLAFLDHHTALGRAGDGGDAAPGRSCFRSRSSKSSVSNSDLASSSLAKRMSTSLSHQMQEFIAEAADAETVRQRQRHAARPRPSRPRWPCARPAWRHPSSHR